MRPAECNRTFQPHLHATLPTGAEFVPGVSHDCFGPGPCGGCSGVPAGSPQPCDGATWHYCCPGQANWSFVFRSGSSVCPLAVLDPLAGVPSASRSHERQQRPAEPRPGREHDAEVGKHEVARALSITTASLLEHPGEVERAARRIQSELGWSFERARWFIHVNTDRLPGASAGD